MKNTRSVVPVAFVAIVLALISIASVYSFADENFSVPTKKELKVLLKTAKEPTEHRRIAAYYRQEAKRLTADAKFHEEMGKSYEKQPLSFEAKHPYGTLGVSHCHYWAELNLKEAREADALAALHEDMAKAAEKK